MSQNIIYTDGACSKNGQPDATGGFGIYLYASCFGDNIKINCKGSTMKLNLDGVDQNFPITNIRMEGLAIIATECKSACVGESNLEQRIRKAMAPVAHTHWMFPGDENADLRFRGAIAGALLAPKTTETEKDQIKNTLKQLRSLSALISGVPVDLEAITKFQEENPPLPLMKWWHEIRDEQKAA